MATQIQCDGCGRKPNFWEWVRGELTADGYSEWRHPGIAFRKAGCPISYENKIRAAHCFHELFGRPLPDEPGYLCPQCQTWAEGELPRLV